ncbi:MAG: aminotransferase class V-fold PLP-dependent enzyme [Clostridia bacterium]|jgi:cysteine desulfurase family protein|nr:aminotransferase class V-fold PLP-dependent enzyme [Clostridia bacterium]
MIYLDNSATTLIKPPQVAQAVYDAINTMGNSGRGAYNSSISSSMVLYETRELIAEMFNLHYPEQVAFTLNATEALNTAINGLISYNDHIITTELEHNSVLRPLYRLEEKGTELTIIKANDWGNINYIDIEKAIKYNTKAIVCTHCSNLTGNVLDIAKIGEICKRHNILFILDASQSAGIFDIDMEKQNIDVVCFTGHKSLYGPQGTGGICIKKGVNISPLKVGGSGIKTFEKTAPSSMPEHIEAGTVNSHSIAGLKAGLEFIQKTGISKIREKENMLVDLFYNSIKNIKDIKIYGDFSTKERGPIVSLNLGNYSSSSVSDELFERFEIATRSGGHCAPLMHKALSTEKQGAVRFSFSYFNTKDEVLFASKALKILGEE